MAYYNHFSNEIYQSILFENIKIGDKFRLSMWKGKHHRKDIIMIKKSNDSYFEFRSKIVHLLAYPENMMVKSYDKIIKEGKT
jgi:hypothetical protein